MRRRQWEKPVIVATRDLPDVLGNCEGGTTEIIGPGGGCFNGQITAENGAAGGHACATGGQQIGTG